MNLQRFGTAISIAVLAGFIAGIGFGVLVVSGLNLPWWMALPFFAAALFLLYVSGRLQSGITLHDDK